MEINNKVQETTNKPQVSKEATDKPVRTFSGDRPQNADGKRQFRRRPAKNQEYQLETIKIKKICKVVKGGRRFRFSVLVVTGNKQGKVGYGCAKAYEVPDAIKKAQKQAMKNLFTVSLIGQEATIPHEFTGKKGASKIFLKPAPEGTGIVAGGAVRSLIELSGIKNIYTKSLGSRSSMNMILATAQGLKSMRTAEQVAELRTKSVQDIVRK